MKSRLIGFLFLMLLGAPFTAGAEEYTHSLTAEKMTVQWRVDETMIYFKLTAPTEGWVGIGFDPEDAMQGSDIIMGAVKKGRVKIVDHYGDKKRGHTEDEKLGGKEDVVDPQGSEVDGMTSIWFSRPLAGNEKMGQNH